MHTGPMMWALFHCANAMTAPLQGIHIVDLSTVFSGPMCAALLADQGAAVVKVESPEGDTTRNTVSYTHLTLPTKRIV